MLEHVGTAAGLLASPHVLFVILLSGVYGLFIGMVPGLTATMAAALLVPFTFFLDPVPALGAIVTMEAMAIFAGDIPGALVRIPGTPSSAAYTDESYRMTQKGEGRLVLGVDLMAAVIGGIMGSIVLMTAAPLLAEVALQFTSYEYFWLAALGLSATVMIASASPLKAGLALLVGLVLSTVGLDITLGYPRFTFGTIELLNGVNFIPAMIGLFGVSEILRNVAAGELRVPAAALQTRGVFRGVGRTLRRYRANVARSGLLGTTVGILPGAGADIAAWLAYAMSRRLSKEPQKFGTGHVEGIVDAGTANNAALAGAWVPALVFGIPGDSITAIVIGVLFMKGLRPGPMIFEERPEMLYAVYLTFILANLLMIPLGYLAIRTSTTVIRVRRNVLLPVILLFCTIGAYAINNTLFDVWMMLAMGVLGYLFEANGIPVAPVVLGLVLGPILEQNFMISMIKSDWDLTQFFTRPVSGLLGGLTVFTWFAPLLAPPIARWLTAGASAKARD